MDSDIAGSPNTGNMRLGALMDRFVKTHVLKCPINSDDIKEEIQEKSIQFGGQFGDRNPQHSIELAKYDRKKFCALKAKLRFMLLEHGSNDFLPLKSLVKKLTAGITVCKNDREEGKKLVLCMRSIAAKQNVWFRQDLLSYNDRLLGEGLPEEEQSGKRTYVGGYGGSG